MSQQTSPSSFLLDKRAPGLLPCGFEDLLGEDARREWLTVAHFLSRFDAWGYQLVKPPLLEYEETLTAGTGTELKTDLFRLMDPASPRTLALRADITVQLARIARTRHADSPKPMRFCYAGQVFRVVGRRQRPERQFTQTGLEIIGLKDEEKEAGDAEVLTLLIKGLEALGLSDLILDISLPSLAPGLLEDTGLGQTEQTWLLAALARKDEAALDQPPFKVPTDLRRLLCELVRSTGPFDDSLSKLQSLLGKDHQESLEQARNLARHLRKEIPGLSIALDPAEPRSSPYHFGLGFALYHPRHSQKLGAGGRYLLQPLQAVENEQEVWESTGASLYLDALLEILPKKEVRPRCLVVGESEEGMEASLRKEGFILLNALGRPTNENAALQEARRQGCSILLWGKKRLSV